jgi:hypothetical protein
MTADPAETLRDAQQRLAARVTQSQLVLAAAGK